MMAPNHTLTQRIALLFFKFPAVPLKKVIKTFIRKYLIFCDHFNYFVNLPTIRDFSSVYFSAFDDQQKDSIIMLNNATKYKNHFKKTFVRYTLFNGGWSQFYE